MERTPTPSNQIYRGSLRKSIDTLESLVREPDALSERIRRDGNYLSKAALNLMGSDYPKLTAYLVQALESGISGFGVIKGLRWRAKPLMENEADWHNFMLTYGEFAVLSTQWPDDDLSYVEYFVAKLRKIWRDKNERNNRLPSRCNGKTRRLC